MCGAKGVVLMEFDLYP